MLAEAKPDDGGRTDGSRVVHLRMAHAPGCATLTGHEGKTGKRSIGHPSTASEPLVTPYWLVALSSSQRFFGSLFPSITSR